MQKLKRTMPAARRGWVYVIQTDDDTMKIGFTTDPAWRLRISSAYPRDSYVWACVEGTIADERWLLRRWTHTRIRGEWFAFTEELAQACDDGTLFDRPGGLCRFSREAA